MIAKYIAKSGKGGSLQGKQAQWPRTEQNLTYGIKVGLAVGVRIKQTDTAARRFAYSKKNDLFIAESAQYVSGAGFDFYWRF